MFFFNHFCDENKVLNYIKSNTAAFIYKTKKNRITKIKNKSFIQGYRRDTTMEFVIFQIIKIKITMPYFTTLKKRIIML